MKQLFAEFSELSTKQWKQQIQFELQGGDYNDTMIWHSPEGIQVKPFYNRDDFAPSSSVSTPKSPFSICQNIFVQRTDKSNRRALQCLERGAESLRFTIHDEKMELKPLLENIDLGKTPLYFNCSFLSAHFTQKIDALAQDKKTKIFCNLDPIGQLAKEGNWFSTQEKSNFETLELLSKTLNSVSLLSVNTGLYQNAGANCVQQIAYGLGHVNEYFNRFSIQQPIVFQVAVGTNYFFEIAKIRALRLLFQLIAKEYQHPFDCHLFATPTKRNKTLFDYNVNLLRTTTECMSASLGGADAIANLPFDALFKKENEFGDRIARNQLLILQNESHFDKVYNPAAGSYYIETLTQQLAEKALALFKETEANGGFLKQLVEGVIKKKIQESANKEQALFDQGKEILLGTNAHLNPEDIMKDQLELFPFVKIKPRKTLISPLIEIRLAEKLEQERLKKEK